MYRINAIELIKYMFYHLSVVLYFFKYPKPKRIFGSHMKNIKKGMIHIYF